MDKPRLTTKEVFREWFEGDPERCPVASVLGMRLVEWDAGTAVIEFEAEARHANPGGMLHGGVLCDIADAAMGTAFASTLEGDESLTNVELKINFLRPFRQGALRFVGKVIHRGRTAGFMECEVTDERKRLIAKANTTILVLRGDAATNR